MKTILNSSLAGVLSLACCFVPVQAKQVQMKTELANPVLPANKKETTFLKVSLTGFKLDEKADRTPANIAIVLDKSGSMQGMKIKRAKEAAKLAVDLLDEKDTVSIVSYDSTVDVIVPAIKVSNKQAIKAAIEEMKASGGTALFAGVSKGANEIRKFLDKERVNRVILLSDGQANVGPSSPSELGELGKSLGKEGISVTTIGLGTGYNEDLMTQLAGFSDGNHAFVKNAEDLAKIFQYEFGDVLSVVAQDVNIQINLADGIKPLRILGREGDILGSKVSTRLSQLYSEQEKYILLEVEVDEGKDQEIKPLADVKVSYQNMANQKQDRINEGIKVAYSKSQNDVKQAVNRPVVKAATKQVSNAVSKKALELRDQGKREEASQLLKDSASYIRQKASSLGGAEQIELEAFSDDVAEEANTVVEERNWNESRKSIREKQYKLDKQQSY